MHGVDKNKQNAIGFGAVAVYCVAIAFIVGGVYGFDAVPLLGNSGDTTSSRPVKGKMLLATEDRVHCQQYAFNNETQEISKGQLIFCDENWKKLDATNAPVNGIRDAFRKR